VGRLRRTKLVDPLACDVRALETCCRRPARFRIAGGNRSPDLERAIGSRAVGVVSTGASQPCSAGSVPSLAAWWSALLDILLAKSEQFADGSSGRVRGDPPLR